MAKRSGLAAVTRLGLVIASAGFLLMVTLALADFHTFASYFLPMLVFLFGMGMLNPIGTALTLTPFGERAGAAPALLGFMQMAFAALSIIASTSIGVPPFVALSTVLAMLTTIGAIIFRMRA